MTGKRGEGKTLASVVIAGRYLAKGRPVATNIDLFVEHLLPAFNKTNFYRLPDCPSSQDLNLLPLGNPEPQKDKKNGLLMLDEAAVFMNSREWRSDDRMGLIRWLAHSRKYGWDLLLIAQHPKMIDSQVRDSLLELHASAKRMDKIGIPFLSFLAQYYFGLKLRLPKLHVVTTRYGFGNNAPVASTEVMGGTDYYKAYDTTQKINVFSTEPGTKEVPNTQVFGCALATMLSPWYLSGRYKSRALIVAKYGFGFLLVGLFFGVLSGHFLWPEKKPSIKTSVAVSNSIQAVPQTDSKVVTSVIHREHGFTVILSDGSVKTGTDYKINLQGEFYKVGDIWYRKGA